MDTVFDESAPRTSLALPPRTILNDAYEVGRVLGKGGFGITYAAMDTHLQVPVAIKEFLPAQVAGRGTDRSTVQPHGGNESDVFEHGLNAFLAEAQTLAQFNHPNIVQVRAFFRQNGTGYLVMPFYEGKTLDAVLNDHEGPMPCDEALALVEPVMNGLEAVHARNILHRDIKPQNVYLTDSGETILLDFGAARIAFGQESQSLSAVLTPGYAPFEQYSRRGHQGPWTDVYATAAMLYRMVTGDKPPEATDRLAGEPLAPIHLKNPSATPSFADAVTTALSTLPKDRPQSIADFRSQLAGATGTVIVQDETVLVPDATVLDDATVLEPQTKRAESRPDARQRPETVLVLRAVEACRYKLDGGEVVSMAAGEERVEAVTPGEHEIAGAFGDQRHRTTVRVARGERRVVPLAAPASGRGRGASVRGVSRPSRPAGKGISGWIWALGGAGALLLLLVVAAIFAEPDVIDPQTNTTVQAASIGTPLQFGGIGQPTTTTGVLGAGDGTLPTGEFADLYTVDARQANYLYVEMTSGDFDPYLILRGPNGDILIQNDDFGDDTTVSYFDVELPTPGVYQIFATSHHAGETGSYTLVVTPDQL